MLEAKLTGNVRGEQRGEVTGGSLHTLREESDADDHAGDRRVIEFNMRTNAGKERPISSGSIAVDAFVEGVMPVWLRHRRWGPRFALR